MPDTGVEREVLSAIGAEVVRASCKTPEEVIEVARQADALMVQWAPITAEVIQALERCQIVSRYGIGLDMIDLEAAAARGIRVVANADYCIREVAEHALALLLASARKLAPAMTAIRAGNWNKRAIMTPTRVLSEQTLGIVGLGKIGRELARLAAPLMQKVLAYDPLLTPRSDLSAPVELVGFDELLSRSDFVSLHCPLTEATRNLFNENTFRSMKRTVWLINASRGGLVDEQALYEALTSGIIGGAALDVFVREPLPKENPLLQLSNVLATPHTAWYSDRAYHLLQENTARAVVDHFLRKS
jgi:D-3-phosphoglycerate dehydrogenase